MLSRSKTAAPPRLRHPRGVRHPRVARPIPAWASRGKAATPAVEARCCPGPRALICPNSLQPWAACPGLSWIGGLSGGVVPHPPGRGQKGCSGAMARGGSAPKVLKYSYQPSPRLQGRQVRRRHGVPRSVPAFPAHDVLVASRAVPPLVSSIPRTL